MMKTARPLISAAIGLRPRLRRRAPTGNLHWSQPLLLVCTLALSTRAQHLHLQISRPAGEWRLSIHDFDSGDFDPAHTPLHAGHTSFGLVPANAYTNFLGHAGAPVWTLPESENPELIYLGIGTSGIAPGTFSNDQIHLQLRSLNGPGHFALYNVDPFGGPVVHMNSRDGIDPIADSLALSALGGHAHVNWAFSAPGHYRIGFSASGRIPATGETNLSATIEYTFVVQDLPWRPQLTLLPTANGLTLSVRTEPGRSVRLESSLDLDRWHTVTNFVALSADTAVPIVISNTFNLWFRAVTPVP